MKKRKTWTKLVPCFRLPHTRIFGAPACLCCVTLPVATCRQRISRPLPKLDLPNADAIMFSGGNRWPLWVRPTCVVLLTLRTGKNTSKVWKSRTTIAYYSNALRLWEVLEPFGVQRPSFHGHLTALNLCFHTEQGPRPPRLPFVVAEVEKLAARHAQPAGIAHGRALVRVAVISMPALIIYRLSLLGVSLFVGRTYRPLFSRLRFGDIFPALFPRVSFRQFVPCM